MKRAKRGEEIQLLSTSFLDLMCCGLCGVVLLWVLNGRATHIPAFKSDTFIDVGQTGLWHFNHLTVSRHGASDIILYREGGSNSKDNPSMQQKLRKEYNLDVDITGGNSIGDFKGLITIVIHKNTEDLSVRVDFDVCDANANHVVKVVVDNGRKRTQDSFVYKYNDKYQMSGSDTFRVIEHNFRNKNETPNPATVFLNFQISNGRVSYEQPSAVK